jgi:hypothetical protein
MAGFVKQADSGTGLSSYPMFWLFRFVWNSLTDFTIYRAVLDKAAIIQPMNRRFPTDSRRSGCPVFNLSSLRPTLRLDVACPHA